jgi:hypothetical protein
VAAAAGSTHGRAVYGGGGSTSSGHYGSLGRSTSSPRRDGSAGSSGRHGRGVAAPEGTSAAENGAATPVVAAAADDSGTNGAQLPPRLVVFHPAGDFGIGVDKAREAELQSAAEAAAAQRQQHRQRAAAAALGPAGVRSQPGSPPPPDDEGVTSAYAGYRQIYLRQKVRWAGLRCGEWMRVGRRSSMLQPIHTCSCSTFGSQCSPALPAGASRPRYAASLPLNNTCHRLCWCRCCWWTLCTLLCCSSCVSPGATRRSRQTVSCAAAPAGRPRPVAAPRWGPQESALGSHTLTYTPAPAGAARSERICQVLCGLAPPYHQHFVPGRVDVHG